ncbi:MAG: glucose-1-phosphate adenylyltransferase [Candidatus Omnitrophota bacterium]
MKSFKNNVLAFVLAGGKGERLQPLTLERTKPSIPFGGKYRTIDFALSNLINSEINSIYVLVQYKSQSLIEHIRTSWRESAISPKQFITVVPPQMRQEGTQHWYRGTADSIYQNINLIYDFKPKYVAIFSGDHIYRMNIKEMVNYHIKKKSQVTISAIPMQAEEAGRYGVINTDSDLRVKNFREKPSISKNKDVFASMGNYIFDTEFILQILNKGSGKKSMSDFGRNIIPHLIKDKARVFAYNFSKNRVPFLKKHELKYYWKDVGTLSSYWQANMDLLGRKPVFDLDNQYWPIYASSLNCLPAYTAGAEIENSLICEGTKIFGAKIKNSIIGRSVLIEEKCLIENSIIMDFTHVKKNCIIKKAIIDRYNTIDENTVIDSLNGAIKAIPRGRRSIV